MYTMYCVSQYQSRPRSPTRAARVRPGHIKLIICSATLVPHTSSGPETPYGMARFAFRRDREQIDRKAAVSVRRDLLTAPFTSILGVLSLVACLVQDDATVPRLCAYACKPLGAVATGRS